MGDQPQYAVQPSPDGLAGIHRGFFFRLRRRAPQAGARDNIFYGRLHGVAAAGVRRNRRLATDLLPTM